MANNLWEKAEYVARENEQRRLKQIFVESFTERFRELKPEFIETENSSFEAGSNTLTSENTDSINNSLAPEIIEPGEEESTTVTQEKSDEFLGFIKSDESSENASNAESEAKITTALEETAQTAHETVSETLQLENQRAVDVTPNDENQTESVAEKPNAIKPQTDASAAKTEKETTGAR